IVSVAHGSGRGPVHWLLPICGSAETTISESLAQCCGRRFERTDRSSQGFHAPGRSYPARKQLTGRPQIGKVKGRALEPCEKARGLSERITDDRPRSAPSG